MIGKFINTCEDSCTAAVFGHLLHLPIEMFWGIVSRACFSDSLPTNPGEIEDRAFWPSWNAEGTSNSQRVVPDLFIRFSALGLRQKRQKAKGKKDQEGKLKGLRASVSGLARASRR